MKRSILLLMAVAACAVGCQKSDAIEATPESTTPDTTIERQIVISATANELTRGSVSDSESAFTYLWEDGESFILQVVGYTFNNGANYTTTTIGVVDDGATISADTSFDSDTVASGTKIVSMGGGIGSDFSATMPTEFANGSAIAADYLYIQGAVTTTAEMSYSELSTVGINHTLVPAIVKFTIPAGRVSKVTLSAASAIFPTAVTLDGETATATDYASTITITNDAVSSATALYALVLPTEVGSGITVTATVDGADVEVGTLTSDNLEGDLVGGTAYVIPITAAAVSGLANATVVLGVDAVESAELATFTTDTTWSAVSSADWLTLSESQGSAGEGITLSYTATSNLATSSSAMATRTATVTITMDDKVGTSYTYTIGQDAQYKEEHTFSSDTWSVRADTDTISYSADGSVSLGSADNSGAARINYGTSSLPFGKYEFEVSGISGIDSNGWVNAYLVFESNENDYIFTTFFGSTYNPKYGIDKSQVNLTSIVTDGSSSYTYGIEVYAIDGSTSIGANWYLNGGKVYSYTVPFTSSYSTIYNLNVGATGVATVTYNSWSYTSPVTAWSAE